MFVYGNCNFIIEYNSHIHLPLAITNELSAEGSQANICVLNEVIARIYPFDNGVLESSEFVWHLSEYEQKI